MCLKHVGKKISLLFIVMTLFSISGFTYSERFKLNRQLSLIKIYGHSTMHDWTINAEDMNGTMLAEVELNELKKIDSVQIKIPVISLKSGKSGMDEHVYKTLKQEQFPEIKYKMNYYTIENSQMNVTGQLTIAGVSRDVTTIVYYNSGEAYLKFGGKLDVFMSQYNLKPNELLFGALKTTDKVTIRFMLYFNASDEQISNLKK